jgi:hypothetical protein
LTKQELETVLPHIFSFYESVKLSLAVVRGKEEWQPVYFLAEYDYLSPIGSFKVVFDTPQFRILSGSIDTGEWDGYYNEILNGGAFLISLENGDYLRITFPKWPQDGPCFETGEEARSAWKRPWPCVRTNFHGGNQAIDTSLWTLMKNAAMTYKVPYASVAEAVSDILGITEANLEFKNSQMVHGSILFPIFASFESAKYVRERQKLHLSATVVYHCKVNPETLYVSARVETREQGAERLQKRSMASTTIPGREQELCRSEWRSPVETAAGSVRHTNFYLINEAIESFSLLIDEANLRFVPELVTELEIRRLMTEKTDRRELDHIMKIEKGLLERQGKDFEEALFMLLCRMGFDVAWENENSPFDILAVSPNGCLVVECKSKPPTAAMAEELRDLARSYVNENNPYVMPVLATNLTKLSDLDRDLMQVWQRNEVCMLTRDRLEQLLNAVKHESLEKSERYLQQYFTW